MRKKTAIDNHWGQHLIINAMCCDYNKSKDAEYILKFIKELCNIVGSKYSVDPKITNFEDDISKTRYTAIQITETSSIVAHFIHDNGDLYLDVFSCLYFDVDKIKKSLKEWFEPVKITSSNIYRDAHKGNSTELYHEHKYRELS